MRYFRRLGALLGGTYSSSSTSSEEYEENEDDEEEEKGEEVAKRDRLGLTKKRGDDEENDGTGDIDLDDDDIDEGDDWEHEEIFADGDEAVKNLLGRAAGLEADAEVDDDEQDEASLVLAPPDVDKSPSKPKDTKAGKRGKGISASSKSRKGKRKVRDEGLKLTSSSKKPKN